MAECEDFLGFFAQWSLENTPIAGHISLLNGNKGDGSKPSVEFLATRKQTHKTVCAQLLKVKNNAAILLSKAERDVAYWTSQRNPPVPRIVFDLQEHNMSVRKVAVLDVEILKLNVIVRQKRLELIQDILKSIINTIELLQKPNVIPENFCLKLEPSFYEIDVNERARKEQKLLERLNTHRRFLIETIRSYSVPVWLSNYPKFFSDLVDEMLPRMDQECLFVGHSEKEISLSRCLFDSRSTGWWAIDDVISKNIRNPDFAEEIVEFCYTVIPGRERMSLDQQSVALLLMFRIVFHRAYEKFSPIFRKPPDPDMEKVREIGALPLRLFNVPLEAMSKEWSGDEPIEHVFRNEPLFRSASLFLSSAVFESNPIDTLYAVHKSLLCIKKGALINSHQRLGGDVSPTEVNNCLCFDDFFALLIGVFLASDVPDIFNLSWFVSTFVPKSRISSSFTFALANLEGLASHIRALDVTELKKCL